MFDCVAGENLEAGDVLKGVFENGKIVLYKATQEPEPMTYRSGNGKGFPIEFLKKQAAVANISSQDYSSNEDRQNAKAVKFHTRYGIFDRQREQSRNYESQSRQIYNPRTTEDQMKILCEYYKEWYKDEPLTYWEFITDTDSYSRVKSYVNKKNSPPQLLAGTGDITPDKKYSDLKTEDLYLVGDVEESSPVRSLNSWGDMRQIKTDLGAELLAAIKKHLEEVPKFVKSEHPTKSDKEDCLSAAIFQTAPPSGVDYTRPEALIIPYEEPRRTDEEVRLFREGLIQKLTDIIDVSLEDATSVFEDSGLSYERAKTLLIDLGYKYR